MGNGTARMDVVEPNVVARDRRRLSALMALSLVYCLWLLWKPVGGPLFMGIASLIMLVNMMVGVAWIFQDYLSIRRSVYRSQVHRDALKSARPLVYFGFGQVCCCAGNAIWLFAVHVFRYDLAFPSVAEALYLLAYPLFLVAVLLLPSRPIPSVLRWRVVLDGAMTWCAAIALAWFFVIGPTILNAGSSPLAKFVSAAFPLGGLQLLFCLLVLSANEHGPTARAGIRWIVIGLLCIIGADMLFAYLNLKGTYETGNLLNLAWPIGHMLVAFGVCSVARPSNQVLLQTSLSPERRNPVIWRSMVPYALIPVVGALALCAMSRDVDPRLSAGVYICLAILIAAVIVRQIFALIENSHLNEYLQTAYSQLTEKNQALQMLVSIDSMTGLANHGAFHERLRVELARIARSGKPLSLMLIDADYFKRYNDSFGHQAGDQVLKSLAKLFEENVRTEDLVARYGGEEFAVILVDSDSASGLMVAERMRAAVEHKSYPNRTVTVSIGLATALDGADAALLIAHADQALYAAKRAGRNMVEVWRERSSLSLRDLPPPDLTTDDEIQGSAETADADPMVQLESGGGVIRGVLAALDLRDCETNGHSQRVARFGLRLAQELPRHSGYRLSPREMRELYLGGLLHDIGKLGVPDHVLLKADVLTTDEWELIQRHPVQGAELLSRFPELSHALPVVLHHHERWDGSGYPHGLAGDKIPLSARVFAVADALDAMSCDRPYRARLSSNAIREEMKRGAGTQFEPEIVSAFLAIDESEWTDCDLPNPATIPREKLTAPESTKGQVVSARDSVAVADSR